MILGCLLKLYIYGYYNGVRSSRKLEKECNRIKMIGENINETGTEKYICYTVR